MLHSALWICLYYGTRRPALISNSTINQSVDMITISSFLISTPPASLVFRLVVETDWREEDARAAVIFHDHYVQMCLFIAPTALTHLVYLEPTISGAFRNTISSLGPFYWKFKDEIQIIIFRIHIPLTSVHNSSRCFLEFWGNVRWPHSILVYQFMCGKRCVPDLFVHPLCFILSGPRHWITTAC